jgi:hypothetical protein
MAAPLLLTAIVYASLIGIGFIAGEIAAKLHFDHRHKH